MALGSNTIRGLTRFLPGTARQGGAVPRLVIYPDDTTPVYEPLFIRPTEVPSGTLAEGSTWFDDDNHHLAYYNGTGNVEVVDSGSGAQTIGGALTVTGALTASSTVAATGLISGGLLRTVKTGAATLTAAESGAHCIFNNATGFLYTLPAAQAGLEFTFSVQTTVTSGNARVACASGDFLLGTIIQVIDTTFAPTARDADGSTHLAWEGNGTTTGGIKGDWFRVVAISGTQWAVYGFNTATGSEATPFKTS